jgi:glycine cleavage system H protein
MNQNPIPEPKDYFRQTCTKLGAGLLICAESVYFSFDFYPAMNFPSELRYTKEHEWIRVESSTATVGITEYAQGELGDVIFIDVKPGGEVSVGDSFGSVEAVKTVSDLYAPVAGSVTEVNPALNDNPELVNKDPYGEGWLVKMAMSDANQASGLLSADEYKKLIGQ